MATKLKYNATKLKESGETLESLKRIGFNIQTVGKTVFFVENGENVEITQRSGKLYIADVELSQALRSRGKLKEYLEANSHIFGDEKADAFEGIVEYVEEYKNDILRVGDNIFMYDKTHYKLLDMQDLERLCYSTLRESVYPSKVEVEAATYFIYNEFLLAGRKYDLKNDYSYLEEVKLAFQDGTLIISKDKSMKFIKGHRKTDNLFFCFEFNYLDLPKSTGIVKEWFNKRFRTEEDRFVIQAGIADLFITHNFSQCMFYIYGAGGVGKSLLQETLAGMLSENATATVNVNELNEQFKTAALFRSIINFSSEISRKQISQERFKSFIARDDGTLSIKFKQDCKGRPIAKWLSVANTLPTIEMDSGVKRRLLAIECTEEKIIEYNGEVFSKASFEKAFKADKAGMLEIIISGIFALFSYNFELSDMYAEMIDTKYFKEVENHNDPIAFFLDQTTIKTGIKKKGIIKENLFIAFEESFRRSTMGTAIMPMKAQTFFTRLKELGYKDKRDKVKLPDGKYTNTKAYFEGLSFKDEFLKKLQEQKIDFIIQTPNLEVGEVL